MAEILHVCKGTLQDVSIWNGRGKDWVIDELKLDDDIHRLFPDVGVKTADLVEVDTARFDKLAIMAI